jgi:ActR/RegA family two-component response regulator
MTDDVRVLLVDDERLVRRSMEKTMLRAGFDVETAHDARNGLELFKAAQDEGDPFHVAVLDLHMPDLTGQDNPNAGMELLSRLLENDANLPVVVLSAFDQVGRAKEAISRGARAYFVKGREAGLIEIINDILSE